MLALREAQGGEQSRTTGLLDSKVQRRAMEKKVRNTKTDFWTGEKYAIVGVSDKKGKFGNTVFKELQKRGYRVFPVNQKLELFEGRQCYKRLSEIVDQLDGVIIIAGPQGAKKVIRGCLNLGVKKVWLYPGTKCDEAIDLAKKGEIDLIHGVCPLLYLEPVKFPHSLHRWIVRVLGKL
jgi:predicted CoA-binding protein